MTQTPETEIVTGTEIDIPLNRLKKSPKNARKAPHAAEAIEALAASIHAKKLLQAPVVEPERDADGALTGAWLVTIGEGRRLALKLLAERKLIKKTHLVRCVIDTEFDPQEISLDENVTRSPMHPADQFEAFCDLAERKGWGAEEIGARFGVSAQLVRQRLRLAAVSPRLIAVYREDGLTLDQLMAFAISEDHAHQEQVFDSLSYNRSASFIRQALTAAQVAATDRRAVYVGVEAYLEAGGTLTRDLFTEDRGGWLDDVALLDRLVAEKLAAEAEALRAAEGWKWAEGLADYPSGHGLARVWPHKVARSAEDRERIAAISSAYDTLVDTWAEVEDLPPEIAERLAALDAELEAFGEDYAYDPDEIARGGLFVVLGHDGATRVERGLIRPQDARPAQEDPEAAPEGEDEGSPSDNPAPSDAEAEDEAGEGMGPLPERLVAELTAYRTASLRDALAEHPETALLAALHALVLQVFYPGAAGSCLDLRIGSRDLEAFAPALAEGPAAKRIATRHEAWARQTPSTPSEVWAFVVGLDSDSRMALFAHCVGLSLDAVKQFGRGLALAQADRLATRVALNVRGDWDPAGERYLGRVTKARILEAVGEGAGADAAARLVGLKKAQMAAAAEPLLEGAGWLPPLLRTAPPEPAVALEAAA